MPFGLYVANQFNWHGPFFFVVGLGALLVPMIMGYLPKVDAHLRTRTKKISPLELIKGIGRDENQRLALALSACLMLGHFMIIPFLNPFMEFNKGFSKTQTPLMYMVGGALTLVSSPILGRIADKVGKTRLFVILVMLAVIPIALITNLPDIPFYLVLCITGFWFIVSSGRSIPAH